jgi:hypothetical protein
MGTAATAFRPVCHCVLLSDEDGPKEELARKPSVHDGNGRYRCRRSSRSCGVCGDTIDTRHVSNVTYARFLLCKSCAAQTAAVGGDLVELARSSTADVLAAAKLCQYVTDLEQDEHVCEGPRDRRTLRQLLHRPAREAISEHMHVFDDEKTALAERYSAAVSYAGHCCAACGARDPALAYTQKLFSVAGPPCVGRGYLRRSNSAESTRQRADERLRRPRGAMMAPPHPE